MKFLIVLTLLAALVAPIGTTRASFSPEKLSSGEREMIDAINSYRKTKKLPPLKVDPLLMKLARQRSPVYSHQVNGKWAWEAAFSAGWPKSGWVTDNLAMGYSDGPDAVRGWATSDGHAHQMRGDFKMNGRWQNYHFDSVGVGISGKKFVAMFGVLEK